MKRFFRYLVCLLGAAAAGASGAALYLHMSAGAAPAAALRGQSDTAARDALQSSVAQLTQELSALKIQVAELSQKPREEMERQMARQVTGDSALVEAVARVAPSVVSIVAAKEVSRLRVE